MMKSTAGNKPARRPGRQRLDSESDAKAVRINLTMTAAQRDKLLALGGSEWVRRKINEEVNHDMQNMQTS